MAQSQLFVLPWPSLQAEQMRTDDEVYETPKWRTAWLMFCFAVLVGIGVVTVLQPEVADEPGEELANEAETSGRQQADQALQE